MQRVFLTVSMISMGVPASAHVGHLAEVVGHGHWLGAAALGAAIALGVWGTRKNAKTEDDEADADSSEEDAQEVPA